MTEVNVRTAAVASADYEKIRVAWANLKDIADSKFRRQGGAGAFPNVSEFGDSDMDIITDSYEADGLHIDLLVSSSTIDSRRS